MHDAPASDATRPHHFHTVQPTPAASTSGLWRIKSTFPTITAPRQLTKQLTDHLAQHVAHRTRRRLWANGAFSNQAVSSRAARPARLRDDVDRNTGDADSAARAASEKFEGRKGDGEKATDRHRRVERSKAMSDGSAIIQESGFAHARQRACERPRALVGSQGRKPHDGPSDHAKQAGGYIRRRWTRWGAVRRQPESGFRLRNVDKTATEVRAEDSGRAPSWRQQT